MLHHPRVSGERLVAALERGVFEHLNHSVDLGFNRPDWRLGPQQRERLWTVTLHYHGWGDGLAKVAAQGGAVGGRALAMIDHYVSDWIDRCGLEQPGTRHLAWNAYAVATRITFWIRAMRRLDAGSACLRPTLREAMLRSLWQQAAYLHRHLEYHLRGNHLLRDAVGLVWAGRFFQGAEADRWLRTGTRLAIEQAREQVLPDGGHFERSPMYHLHAMEDLLSLALLVKDRAAAEELRQTWARMAEFLTWCRHPDGQIPLFNDAALNGAVHPEVMLREGGAALNLPTQLALPRGSRHFSEFGLAVHRSDTWSVFFDCGRIGPDYQPGHAHADTLSIEASYRGERLFVDPGVYAYDHDDRRRYDRATASHNTVCIDGEDSSECWHIFRVGRRAHPRDVSVDEAGTPFTATASHTGYRHLRGRPVHTRRLEVTPRDALVIHDRVTGTRPHTIEAGLLLAPGWQAVETPTGWQLRRGARQLMLHVEGPAALTRHTQAAVYHPEFGREVELTRLSLRHEASLPAEWSFRVEPVESELSEVTSRRAALPAPPALAAAVAPTA